MTRSEREALVGIEGVLNDAGAPYSIDRGRHVVVRVVGPDGGEHKLPVAGSPRSDPNCQKNFGRQKAQRLLREIGFPDQVGNSQS